MRTVIRGVASAAAVAVLFAVPLSGQAPSMLAVENTRSVPVVVYLDRGPYEVRLGTVQPHMKTSLKLPLELQDGEAIQVIVHPEGGTDLSTPDGFKVRKGKTIDVYVPTNDVGWIPAPVRQPAPQSAEGAKGTTVTVTNPRNVPVVVFVDRGDFDARLGTVPGHGNATFPIPEALIAGQTSLDIFVHVESGEDLASQTFDVGPGQHLLVNVPK
jgi:hypothetical protein